MDTQHHQHRQGHTSTGRQGRKKLPLAIALLDLQTWSLFLSNYTLYVVQEEVIRDSASQMAPQQQHLPSFFGSTKKGSKRTRTNHQDNSSRFGNCPLCNECFPMHVLFVHAETCQGTSIFDKHVDKCAELNKGDAKISELDACNAYASVVEPMGKENVTNFVAGTREASSTLQPHRAWWKIPSQPFEIKDPIYPTSEPLSGLFLFKEFISEQEEAVIVAHLDNASTNPWKHGDFNGPHFGKRWGVHCNLRDRRVGAATHVLPSFVTDLLVPRFRRLVAMKGMIPNEANAIDYRRKLGHYLTHHVDDRSLSREPIANLSLVGDCYMVFRNEKGSADKGKKVSLPVLLERRTLQVLTGKARYEYSHGIACTDLLSDRRISVTMRESPISNEKRKNVSATEY